MALVTWKVCCEVRPRYRVAYAVALDIREAWGDRMGVEAMVETALDRVL